ncbi:MAG: translation initiation factor, partial [Bacteroidetes bacterium]|nr:translation initiation factor [Bacteroidota bacterium]
MAKKDKSRINVVYSTNPNFSYEQDDQEEQETLPYNQQTLYVSIDRKNRGGKEVTLIEGFIGTDEDAKEMLE